MVFSADATASHPTEGTVLLGVLAVIGCMSTLIGLCASCRQNKKKKQQDVEMGQPRRSSLTATSSDFNHTSMGNTGLPTSRPPAPVPASNPTSARTLPLPKTPDTEQQSQTLSESPASSFPAPQPQHRLSNPHTHTSQPKAAQLAPAIAKRTLPPAVTVDQKSVTLPANRGLPPVPPRGFPATPGSFPSSSSDRGLLQGGSMPEIDQAPPVPERGTPRTRGSRESVLTQSQSALSTTDDRSDQTLPLPPPRRAQSSDMSTLEFNSSAKQDHPVVPPRLGYSDVNLSASGRGFVLDSQKPGFADLEAELQQKQLERSKLTLITELGKGFFATVYLAKYTPSDGSKRAVAVKAIRSSEEFDDKARRLFLLEAQLMSEFNHPNILYLVGVTTTEDPWCIVTEACQFGDMLTVLRNCRRKDIILTYDEKLLFLAQIALGMSYLASKHFIHRDLAARNCLIAGDATVKIGDFGMSRMLQAQGDYYRSLDQGDAMPLRWMAVESLTNMKFSSKSDVWSFGVVCFEVFSYGEVPYGPLSLLILQDEVEAGRRPDQPTGCPNEFYAFMQQMWSTRPQDRPCFHEIYNGVAQRYRTERKASASARDMVTVLRFAAASDAKEEEDPYKELASARQRKPATNKTGNDTDEDEDDADAYKDLDGTQADYIPATLLPVSVTVPEESQSRNLVYEKLSRPAAERLLLSQGIVDEIQGLFLLRRASNGKDLSLSVVRGENIVHFRVQAGQNGFKIMGKVYANPEELIMETRLSESIGIFLGEYLSFHINGGLP
eukprot:m.186028 g.186028  ORF g.186028 m.186028 type:complete len:778 (+) comp16694_c3_seq3:441-2774(+)